MKKDFKAAAPTREQLNPALQFITLPEETETKTEQETEKRTRRVFLLFYPTMYNALQERAKNHNTSVNNEIIEIITEALNND